MMQSSFRFATVADTARLLEIYRPYVTDSAITFECEVPDFASFRNRIANITATYPYLVQLEGNRIIGYAYAHRDKEREAYRWNVELSIYLDLDFRGKGIGTNLYRSLIAILERQGIQNLYANITVPNEASEHLHRAFGFTKVGTRRQTGYKLGKWYDVALYERHLASRYEGPPQPILPVGTIEWRIPELPIRPAGGAGT